jgi:hypothetical protein
MLRVMERNDISVTVAWVLAALALAGGATYGIASGGDAVLGGVLCIPVAIVCLVLAFSERPTRQQSGSTPTSTTRE